MFQETKKKKFLIKLFYRIIAIILLFLIFLLSKQVYFMLKKQKTIQIEKSNISLKLKELEEKKSFLEKQTGQLQTEKGIEKEILEKFNVSRQGEKVIMITGTTSVNSLEKEIKNKKNLFEKIKDFFINLF
jgi:hypothetical protein